MAMSLSADDEDYDSEAEQVSMSLARRNQGVSVLHPFVPSVFVKRGRKGIVRVRVCVRVCPYVCVCVLSLPPPFLFYLWHNSVKCSLCESVCVYALPLYVHVCMLVCVCLCECVSACM